MRKGSRVKPMTGQILWCLLLLLGYLRAAPPPRPVGRSATPLTVCELFAHLRRYNGKVVTIVGPIIAQPDYTVGQADCHHSFITHGFAWPSMVMLTSTEGTELYGASATFLTDQGSLQTLDSAVIAATKATEIWVTVTGELRLKRHYHAVHTNYGVLGDGYGHLGASPAVLIIQKVNQVDIREGRTGAAIHLERSPPAN